MEKIKVIKSDYDDKNREISEFLINITSNEFGFVEWQNYFKTKLTEQFKIGNNAFWIALDKDKIVGTCGALQDTQETVKMVCFYVDSKYRKLGIGKILYNQFIKFCEKEKYKKVILTTYKEFDVAIKFYKNNKFRLSNITEDEMLFEKIL